MADDDAKHGGGQADVLGCDEEVVPHHGLTPNVKDEPYAQPECRTRRHAA